MDLRCYCEDWIVLCGLVDYSARKCVSAVRKFYKFIDADVVSKYSRIGLSMGIEFLRQLFQRIAIAHILVL